MRVRMRTRMTGSRNGEDWPAVGGLLDVSDEEGNALIRAGIARAAGADEEDQAGPTVDDATGRAVDPNADTESSDVLHRRRFSPENAPTAATVNPGEEQATVTEQPPTEPPSPRRRRPGGPNEPG